MVSPYLLRPLRSYDEVSLRREVQEAPSQVDDETIVRRALYKAIEEGRGPLAQIDRALSAIMAIKPSMAPMEALDLVNRVRQASQSVSESV